MTDKEMREMFERAMMSNQDYSVKRPDYYSGLALTIAIGVGVCVLLQILLSVLLVLGVGQ